jgi:hypothetical protein
MRALNCFLLCLFLVSPAPGDIVHLRNGNSLEGVVTAVTSSEVTLRLAIGELELPLADVREIEQADSTLAEFFRRRSVLRTDEASQAADWLDLAAWAWRQGLDHSAGEAAMVAARLDPRLPALEPFMTERGYVFDDSLARWVPYDAAMRQRGYVEVEETWLPREEVERQERERADEARTRRAEARQDRLASLVELLVLTQIVEAEEEKGQSEETERQLGGFGYVGYAAYPGFYTVRRRSRVDPDPETGPPPRPAAHRSRVARGYDQLLFRQPGSLIPVGGHGGASSRRPHGVH